MIYWIAEALKPCIDALEWTDKVGGVVKPYYFSDTDGTEMAVPVSCDLSPDCEFDKNEFTPNPSKRSVIFFEDRGTKEGAQFNFARKEYISDIRLVAWINKKLIQDACEDDSRALADLLSCLNQRSITSTPLASVRTEVTAWGSNNAFGGYSIPKIYFNHPFACFFIDIKATYMADPSCFAPLTVDPDLTNC